MFSSSNKLSFRNITEASKIEDYNRQLKENLHIPVTLDGVFIDAYATRYPEDENQQVAFQRETAKLWDFISSKGNFTFKSIQDILDELHVCKEETAKDIAMLKKENEDRKEEIYDLGEDAQNIETEIESMKTAPIGTIIALWSS